jgi:hypothetical protein
LHLSIVWGAVPLRQPTRRSMSKLLALLATLKAILILAAVRCATGEALPVILISLVLNDQWSSARGAFFNETSQGG